MHLICFVGAAIIVGVVAGGAFLYVKADRLARAVQEGRAEEVRD